MLMEWTVIVWTIGGGFDWVLSLLVPCKRIVVDVGPHEVLARNIRLTVLLPPEENSPPFPEN